MDFQLDIYTLLSNVYHCPNFLFKPVLSKNVLILNIEPNYNLEFIKILKTTVNKFYESDIITKDEYDGCKELLYDVTELMAEAYDNTLLFYEYKNVFNSVFKNIEFLDSYFTFKPSNELVYLAYPRFINNNDNKSLTLDTPAYITFKLPAYDWKQVGDYFYLN